MPTKVFITIDTEEDLWDEWKQRDNPVENIGCLPLLQELFNRFGAIPTYLVNYPVVNNKESCRIIKELHDHHRCEIGAHIHPWNTPPFEEDIHTKNSMICNLSHELSYRKIERLDKEIKDRLGFEPQSFRAGRWGFGPKVASCILELGYKIDTSITPFCDWKNENGPDFSEALCFPYRFDPSDIFVKKSDGCLLEVPPTIGFFQRNFGKCARIREFILDSPLARIHLLGVLDKLKLLNFRWLSPELSTGSEMIQLAKCFIKKGYPFLNMFFHSNSLLPGSNPFVRNEKELEVFLRRIALVLKFVSDKGFEFAPLSDALETLNNDK